MATSLILVSALLHATWNAFVKSDDDRALSLAWIMAVGGIASLIALPLVGLPDPRAFRFLLMTTILQNAYFAFVVLSYRYGDLSQAYPIARGSAALLAAIGSSLLGIDALVPREWLGIVISSIGIASLAFGAARSNRIEIVRTLGYPLLSGTFTAAYSIVDGLGARASGNPLGYVAWMNIATAPFLPLYVLATRGGSAFASSPARIPQRITAALIAMCSYGIAVWALSQGSIGRLAVLRETSVLFAAILGSVVLKEPFGLRRVFSAVLIVIGFLLWP